MLEGRVCLVTGAGRGIGAHIARRMGEEGARLVILDIDEEALGETRAHIVSAGGDVARAGVVDITDRDDVDSFVGATLDQVGKVDVLVNNAGRWTTGAFVDSDPDQWAVDINVNFLGVLNLVHAVLPAMIEAGRGRIVNIVSDSARVGEPYVSVYAGAKGAVIGFSKSLAKEVGRFDVTVNCVSLSTTVTPGAKATFDESQMEKMVKRYPLGRLGRPEDAAGAVLYFASDAAEWVTGQVLGVNGGYAMV